MRLRKILHVVAIVVSLVALYNGNSFANPYTQIEPGMYVTNGLRGGAEIKKLKGNDFNLHVELQYGSRNTGFTGACFARDGEIVCPVVFDDPINATYELIVKSAGKGKIIIDMPGGGTFDLCGAGFCVADEERIYEKVVDEELIRTASKQIDDITKTLQEMKE